MTQLHQPCSSPEQVVAFLRGKLSAVEESDLQSHLDECVACRQLLSSSAADDASWNEVQEFFRGESKFESRSDDAHASHDESEGAESIESLMTLLGPTDDPRMLGRIGGYEIACVLGRGGMGIVFKAYEPSLNRYVAIKLLLPHLAATGAARMRFAREGRAAAAVIDDNVLPIFSVAEWQGLPYLVTQLSRGTNLQKRIAANGPLELREILRLGMQTASGLAAAHAQGLVHRDVKPSNILLDGTVERALLTDFGLARAVDDASITCSGIIAGTPQYMSPEQARGGNVDARSDLFGLGSVLYTMCTSQPPFRAENSFAVLRLITDNSPRPIREINPDIPEWLCAIIDKLMSKQPDDRFQSADEVARLLSACLAHVQQPTTVKLPDELRRITKRRQIIADQRPSISPRALFVLTSVIAIVAFASIWITKDSIRREELANSRKLGLALDASASDNASSPALSVPVESPQDAIVDFELLVPGGEDASGHTYKYARGICVSHEGLVVTSTPRSEWDQAQSITVVSPYQGTARVVTEDKDRGLTLLKMDVTQRKTFSWLPCSSKSPGIGQRLTVLGPKKEPLSVVVSEVDRASQEPRKGADGFLLAPLTPPQPGAPLDEAYWSGLPIGSAILTTTNELLGIVVDSSGLQTEPLNGKESPNIPALHIQNLLVAYQPNAAAAEEPRDARTSGEIVGFLKNDNGEPIRNATVACSSVFDKTGLGGGANAITDAEGRYRLVGLPDGIYNVWLKHYDNPRFTAIADDGLEVVAGQTTNSTLLLVPTLHVTGVLTLEGEPAPAGISVKCFCLSRPESSATPLTAITDVQGRFSFDLPRGRATFVAIGRPPESNVVHMGRVQLPANEYVGDVHLEFKPHRTRFGAIDWLDRSTPGTEVLEQKTADDITGTIVDTQGNPIEMAKIFTESDARFVTSDSQGTFRFPKAKGTQTILRVFKPGYHVWFGLPTSGDRLKIVLEKKAIASGSRQDKVGASRQDSANPDTLIVADDRDQLRQPPSSNEIGTSSFEVRRAGDWSRAMQTLARAVANGKTTEEAVPDRLIHWGEVRNGLQAGVLIPTSVSHGSQLEARLVLRKSAGDSPTPLPLHGRQLRLVSREEGRLQLAKVEVPLVPSRPPVVVTLLPGEHIEFPNRPIQFGGARPSDPRSRLFVGCMPRTMLVKFFVLLPDGDSLETGEAEVRVTEESSEGILSRGMEFLHRRPTPLTTPANVQTLPGQSTHAVASSFGITKAQLEDPRELQTAIREHEERLRGSKVELLLKSGASFVVVSKVASVIQDIGVRNLTYLDKQADDSGYEIIVRCSPRETPSVKGERSQSLSTAATTDGIRVAVPALGPTEVSSLDFKVNFSVSNQEAGVRTTIPKLEETPLSPEEQAQRKLRTDPSSVFLFSLGIAR